MGGFTKFKEEFSKAAVGVFGSGWAWLVVNQRQATPSHFATGQASDKGQRIEYGKLVITTTPNQDSPISQGLIPVLGLDVWEHAYYFKYQNRRQEYVEAFWNVVNWNEVEKNFGEQ